MGAATQRLSLLASEKSQAVATENFARAASIKAEMEQLERALKWASSANDAAAGTHSTLAKLGGYSGGGGGNLGGATGYGLFQAPAAAAAAAAGAPSSSSSSSPPQPQHHSPGGDLRGSSSSHRRMNNSSNGNGNSGYAGQSPIRSDSHYTTALHAQSSARPSVVQDPYVLATQEMRRTRAAAAFPPPPLPSPQIEQPPPSSVHRNSGSVDLPLQSHEYYTTSGDYRAQSPVGEDNYYRTSETNLKSPKGQAGWKPAGAVALHGMRR